ncbi:uncharacterized protein LOC144364045 [Saccoglossus kowalevskii]
MDMFFSDECHDYYWPDQIYMPLPYSTQSQQICDPRCLVTFGQHNPVTVSNEPMLYETRKRHCQENQGQKTSHPPSKMYINNDGEKFFNAPRQKPKDPAWQCDPDITQVYAQLTSQEQATFNPIDVVGGWQDGQMQRVIV